MADHEEKDEKERTPYEAPILFDLGPSVAYAQAGPCKPGGSPGGDCKAGGNAAATKCASGTTATGGPCRAGGVASDRCKPGGTAAAGCKKGTSP